MAATRTIITGDAYIHFNIFEAVCGSSIRHRESRGATRLGVCGHEGVISTFTLFGVLLDFDIAFPRKIINDQARTVAAGVDNFLVVYAVRSETFATEIILTDVVAGAVSVIDAFDALVINTTDVVTAVIVIDASDALCVVVADAVIAVAVTDTFDALCVAAADAAIAVTVIGAFDALSIVAADAVIAVTVIDASDALGIVAADAVIAVAVTDTFNALSVVVADAGVGRCAVRVIRASFLFFVLVLKFICFAAADNCAANKE